MWQHLHKEASSVMNMKSHSHLLNSSEQHTNQAGHMLDNLCGNNFAEEGVESWLVLLYIHLHKDGVISLDYVRITLI